MSNIRQLPAAPSNSKHLQVMLRDMGFPAQVKVPRDVYQKLPTFDKVYALDTVRRDGLVVKARWMCCDCEIVSE